MLPISPPRTAERLTQWPLALVSYWYSHPSLIVAFAAGPPSAGKKVASSAAVVQGSGQVAFGVNTPPVTTWTSKPLIVPVTPPVCPGPGHDPGLGCGEPA